MSEIKIEELSKTELKEILTEKKVKFDSDAKHPELIDLVKKTLGTDTIDDGLGDPNPQGDDDAVKSEESDEEDDGEDDEKDPEVVETAAQKKAREKTEKKASQVKRTPGVYIVKDNLKMNGEKYAVGSEIELTESEAESLLESGTVE